jgi:hypothetical protein
MGKKILNAYCVSPFPPTQSFSKHFPYFQKFHFTWNVSPWNKGTHSLLTFIPKHTQHTLNHKLKQNNNFYYIYNGSVFNVAFSLSLQAGKEEAIRIVSFCICVSSNILLVSLREILINRHINCIKWN